MPAKIIILIGTLVATVLAAGRTAMSQESQPPSAPPPAGATMTVASTVRSSYVALKGGAWWMGDRDVNEPETGTYWEVAFGSKFNDFVGSELSFGYLSTEGTLLSLPVKVRSIPLNLSLRVGVPIVLVKPYALLGGGLYLNTLEIGPVRTTVANLGYHSGLGIDFNIGAIVVGIEGRYFVMKGEVLGTTVDLDGRTIAVKAGVRF